MWFFAPPSAWTRLPLRRAGLVDVARDRGRADERHGGDVRVLEDRVDRDLVALDDAEHALGHAGLAQELGDEHRGGRVLLGRLEDERVAARDGVAEHPHRDHGREVERGDARHDAQRLADLVHVDARRGLFAEPALQQVRDAARELEVLEAAGHLAQRVGRDLAVLGGQQAPRCPGDGDRRGSGSGTGSRSASRARSRASPGTPPWPRPRPRRAPRPTRGRPTSPATPWPGRTRVRAGPTGPRPDGRRSSAPRTEARRTSRPWARRAGSWVPPGRRSGGRCQAVTLAPRERAGERYRSAQAAARPPVRSGAARSDRPRSDRPARRARLARRPPPARRPARRDAGPWPPR